MSRQVAVSLSYQLSAISAELKGRELTTES